MFVLPFYIGNILSWFVPGTYRRRAVRGRVNVFFYTPFVKRLIKRVYGEYVNKIEFVRQVTLNRVCIVVNDKYYIKIFRNVSNKNLQQYKVIVDYIQKKLSVNIPNIIVDKKYPMYVCEKLPGVDLERTNVEIIRKNQKKILNQVMGFIKALQGIDVKKIPGMCQYSPLQLHKIEKNSENKKNILGHFDLNGGNLLFDEKFNLLSVIDFDAVAIAYNPDTDPERFLHFFNNLIK